MVESLGMETSKTRRFRFGLRALLILVLFCAIGIQAYSSSYSDLERRIGLLRTGMTPEEVHAVLGEPWHARVFDDQPWRGSPVIWETYLEEGRVGKKTVAVTLDYRRGKLGSFHVRPLK